MDPRSEYDRLPEMTRYVVGLFHRVPDRPDLSEEETDRIQQGHMANMRQLTERGELISAGPFEEDGDLRGVMIFSFGSPARARELFANDPAILNRRIVLELLTWFAPAGLRVAPPGSGSKTAPPDPVATGGTP
jgi:uncharacterized protein